MSMITETSDAILQNLVFDPKKVKQLKDEGVHNPSWVLTAGQICDIELLLNGAFSPLKGFMNEEDYGRVCAEMRLKSGEIWPIPIVLDVSQDFSKTISEGARVVLRHPEGMIIAIMTVQSIWKPNRHKEALEVFGTTDMKHPGVFNLMTNTNPVYLGGSLEGIELPPHHTFKELRQTPAQMRALFRKLSWDTVVAFQTRNPLHRAHVEMTKRAASQTGAKLLIQPVVGRTSPGDIDYYTRVRCYQAVLEHYPTNTTMLNLLPLAMRMAGPREALWHALIRKNYGCTHFIVGRDHAGPGKNRNGKAFYGPYDAQELLSKHQEELGINMVAFEEMVYAEGVDRYMPRSQVPSGSKILSLSGTELRNRLRRGQEIQQWFSYPEVVSQLRKSHPPRCRQGFTIFFTGLSGSGKSTIANVLVAKLMEIGSRPVTLLDGDIVRKNLSSELGFSKEHRDLNIQRIGFVAGEITKNRGIAICAPIAPYSAVRREVRQKISQHGGFIEVYVSTPLETCEKRDRKGLYAQARAGIIKGFTGIDDPYEEPENAEIELDTSTMNTKEAVDRILTYLENEEFLQLRI